MNEFSLATLVDSPQRAAEVPPEQVVPLLTQLLGLFTALLTRLVASPPATPKAASPGSSNDRLLDAREAAPILGVTPSWLYRHAGELPYARRLSRKVLRFSEAGIQQYVASRKPGPRM